MYRMRYISISLKKQLLPGLICRIKAVPRCVAPLFRAQMHRSIAMQSFGSKSYHSTPLPQNAAEKPASVQRKSLSPARELLSAFAAAARRLCLPCTSTERGANAVAQAPEQSSVDRRLIYTEKQRYQKAAMPRRRPALIVAAAALAQAYQPPRARVHTTTKGARTGLYRTAS